ncbi:MAG: hypothetical protein IKY27_00990 [Bacteroidales bacterium]|nr:hypothetical protein [Bacteroidales bacterium]
MKKYILLIITVSLIAFQACKKDNELTNPDRTSRTSKVYNTESSSFNPRAIDDMDSYLTNFLKEIKSPTRDAQPMSVEDAQWHLSACLNFQFCNANVEKTQVVYDTIYTTICVDNGYVSLNDINTSLQEISTEVIDIYTSSNLENKNILFIKPEIQDEATTRSGNIVRTIVATSGRDGVIGNYYFDDEDIPLSLFPEDAEYSWRTTAVDTLEYFINIYEPTKEDIPGRVYYVETFNRECKFNNGFSGRMFFTYHSYVKDYKLNQQQMAYYLDSYLGLIDSLCPANLTYISSMIEPWCGSAPCTTTDITLPNYIHHVLYINYGYAYGTVVPPIIDQL